MKNTLALPVASPIYIKGKPEYLGKIARILRVDERPTVDLPGRWALKDALEADLYISQKDLASLREEQALVYERHYYDNHQGPARLISAKELSEMYPPNQGPIGVDFEALESQNPSRLIKTDAGKFLKQLRRGHVDPKTLKISPTWSFGRLVNTTLRRLWASVKNT